MYLSCRTLEWSRTSETYLDLYRKTMDKDGSLSLYKQPLPMAFNSIYFPFSWLKSSTQKKGSFIFPWQSFKLLSLNASRARCIDCVVPYTHADRIILVDFLLVWWRSIPWMSTGNRESSESILFMQSQPSAQNVRLRFTFNIAPGELSDRK